jgi:uncharacterized protein YbaP (TraB family)
MVKDRDSTILFGTVHILNPETKWRTPRIDAAIAESKELWFELPGMTDEEMMTVMIPLVAQHGLSLRRAADQAQRQLSCPNQADAQGRRHNPHRCRWGHFIGPDSVQVQLKAEGVSRRRAH